MIRSYRVWSAVMGLWYLVLVTSLVRHAPGYQSTVIVDGDKRAIPEHATFFQVLFGPTFYVVMFGGIATALLYASLRRSHMLWRVHLVAMVLLYAFGIGYVAYGVATDTAFAVGALALTSATAHILSAIFRRAIALEAVLEAAQ